MQYYRVLNCEVELDRKEMKKLVSSSRYDNSLGWRLMCEATYDICADEGDALTEEPNVTATLEVQKIGTYASSVYHIIATGIVETYEGDEDGEFISGSNYDWDLPVYNIKIDSDCYGDVIQKDEISWNGDEDEDYMTATVERVDGEKITLYASVPVCEEDIEIVDGEKKESDEANERHYQELKEVIIEQAEENYIDPESLSFFWD